MLPRREQRRDLVANLFLGVDGCSVSVRVAVEGGVDEHWLNDGVKGYLLRHIGIRNYDAALKVITKYYPLERFPQKTLYAGLSRSVLKFSERRLRSSFYATC